MGHDIENMFCIKINVILLSTSNTRRFLLVCSPIHIVGIEITLLEKGNCSSSGGGIVPISYLLLRILFK